MGNKQSERSSHTNSQPRSLDKTRIHDSIEIDFSGRLSYRDDGEVVYLIDHTARNVVEIELSGLHRQRVIIGKTMDSLPWCVKYFSNRLYVTDTFQNTLTMYDTEGKFVCKVGGSEVKLGLNNPRDVCSDDRGLLYLCDNGNNRILILTADLCLVTIVSVPFPSDVIIKCKELLVYSGEMNSIIVVNEEEGVKRYPLEKYKFDQCNKMCPGERDTILFLGLGYGIVVVDQIKFQIITILVDAETKYLNYIANHVKRNTITVLTREKDENRHPCVCLKNIYI